MEDFHVAEFRRTGSHEVGLFAVYDGHSGRSVAHYLQQNLFDNILHQPGFWEDPVNSIMKAYHATDEEILDESPNLGGSGSTAVTAILIDGVHLLVANVGDSRALLCRKGAAIQASVDHDPLQEENVIEERGGFVSQVEVPRVDGILAMSRAFGDEILKDHLSVDPDIFENSIGEGDEFIVLESDGISQVMHNEEVINLVRSVDDPEAAARALTREAVKRGSTDDISAIVVRF
ncbi:hypothetical protein KP509_09G057700 [Ceratopteris richardii]|nr:hypothetical protein KP509_1Z320000 [Ceratopteris richardii]KAH7429590.1 hypothetical protein KP509_09G057700 [Ceratopteris richardii]KAH7429591.1 hypothetical protein KP509_09G057700 [Ceratopteris richardii]